MLKKIRAIRLRLLEYVRFHSRKVGLVLMAVLMVGLSVYLAVAVHVVSIFDGNSTVRFYTMKSDIGRILSSAGFSENYQLLSSDASGNRLNLEVSEIFRVTVTRGSETQVFSTSRTTVRELLDRAGIEVGEKDITNFSPDDILTAEAYLDIVPFVEPEPEPEVAEDSTAEVSAPAAPAAPAAATVSVSVADDGTTISTLIPDTPIQLDENGLPVSYSDVVRVQATAYTYTGFNCSTGVPPQPGYIAVNPAVIPYGTRMYIVSCDGRFNYGYAVAADTGGFIKSRPTNVDLFFPSNAACNVFGRRDVYIYFLD